ncbi:MAG: PTS sugar transporter subunit IIA [Alphaproteobacteria bacterium]
MGVTRYVNFDLLLNRLHVHSKDCVLERFVRDLAPLCALDKGVMRDVCYKRFEDNGISAEKGVAIFDVTSRFVKKPLSALITFERGIAMEALDNKAVDVFVGLVSPGNNVPSHLQRLSAVARLFRSPDLLKALRDARGVDDMKVLFMPTQEWMIAA